ncbi:MAG: DUF2339 domain-containing protein [Thermoanaerobaculales bacterium]
MILALVVIGLPALAVGGLILGLVSLTRTNRLGRRLDDLPDRQTIGPAHPLARRIRDLQRRVEALERESPLARKPAATEESVGPPLEAPAVPAERPGPPAPPVPPEDQSGAPSPPEVPVPTSVPANAGKPAFSPIPPAQARPPRPRIEWERWIGVRGAAAAGGVVLALAALLFFQYSIEQGLISPTMRVVFGVIAGVLCLVGSEWLVKRNQPAAANALAGAGVVILYGATWAAQNLYALIGTGAAVVLMVLITAVCVSMAVSRNARFIAILGLLGGFATPLLVASEVDGPAALFAYILLLDLGLLWLARARDWPILAALSLVGTAFHQILWIFGSMDAERAAIGIAVLTVFGIAFLFVGSDEREPSRLWRATRAGGVAIPFAFAIHFAGTAQLAENPWPLGGLLLILSAGACWLARRETPGSAITAAGASLGIMGLWFLNHRVSPTLAWQAVGLCVALAAVFAVFAEVSRQHTSARRLGMAAVVSNAGFLALLAFAPVESGVVQPWPWIAGWTVLGAGLVVHSRWPGRAWVQLAAGLGPALGLFIAIGAQYHAEGALETWAYLAIIVGIALAFQITAQLTPVGERRRWAERTAAVTALALMPATSLLSYLDPASFGRSTAAILTLGLLAVLSATRTRSGLWFLVATVFAACWQTAIYFNAPSQLVTGSGTRPVFGLLAVSAAMFTVWPALVPGAFRNSRPGWWGAALAGPLWFPVLKTAFVNHFGDGAIGLLPVALAAVALVTVLSVRPRLPAGARRTAFVWYLAVALSLISVAIPLQLDKEWVTIGWALNGLAILMLWVRLSHPGLKHFGLALLGAAVIRLVANPEVLSYHLPVGAPIVNWLTYTYLVPACALIFAHRLLKSREIDRLTAWEARLYFGKRSIGTVMCGLGAVVVVFAWINLVIADVFATGPSLQLSFQRLPARDATTSVAWAVYALILLAIGVRSRSSSMRWLSLGLLVVTLGKVFLYDLGELEDLYRVGSLVGLASSLIVVSLIYQRLVFRSYSGEDT